MDNFFKFVGIVVVAVIVIIGFLFLFALAVPLIAISASILFFLLKIGLVLFIGFLIVYGFYKLVTR